MNFFFSAFSSGGTGPPSPHRLSLTDCTESPPRHPRHNQRSRQQWEGSCRAMPALLFMGRRWGVGADEFALPSLCSMALRVMWSVALVVVLVRERTRINSTVYPNATQDAVLCSASLHCVSNSRSDRTWTIFVAYSFVPISCDVGVVAVPTCNGRNCSTFRNSPVLPAASASLARAAGGTTLLVEAVQFLMSP